MFCECGSFHLGWGNKPVGPYKGGGEGFVSDQSRLEGIFQADVGAWFPEFYCGFE